MCLNSVLSYKRKIGKISAQPHTTLCIQFLDRENSDKNNTLPLGKQISFTIVWGRAEILPKNRFFFISEGGKYKPNGSGLRKYENPINIQGRGFLSTRF